MTGATRLPSSNRRLILFGRYPVPGKTKTRLIPVLGAHGAAQLHRRLAEKSLATAMTVGRSMFSVEFCYTGATRDKVRHWLGPLPARLRQQRGNGLGERMRNALFDAIDQGCRQVVLVGTDIPHMAPEHLQSAFDALNRSDVVLGPSPDGGYWLVGMRCKADIFNDIQWASTEVLDQSVAAAKELAVTVSCIQTLNDMDTESDLRGGLPTRQWQGPYLSVIIPTINEATFIGSAIQRIRSCECEIIVSDGGSTDRTTAIARACGAKIITGIRGRAEQQNAGARIARGKVLLFLHADTTLPDDYMDQVFGTLMGQRVVAGAFQFRTDYHHRGMRLIEKIARIRSTLLQMPYGDQALFLPRSNFESVGGFPLVPIAEDLYLVRRLGRLGRIALAPGAAVTSGRRWRNIGILRTTLINYLIAIGCLMGVDPKKLAPLYRLWVKS